MIATCQREGCTNTFEQKAIGPIKREYCSDRCRQKAYREREKAELTERIAELEHQLVERDELIEGLLDKKQSKQPVKRSEQERLTRVLEQKDWPAFTIHYRVNPGRKEGRIFVVNAPMVLLERALAQLEE